MNLLKRYYKPLIACLAIGIIIFGVGGDVHAAGQCMAENAPSQTSYMTGVIIRWLSWFWFIPAVLAGKLMSNDLLYGQIVGLDTYFYQFWTLMRTIANFSLVAIIVIMIGKILIGKSEPGEVIKNYGFKILVSGILINMSWLIMGALIDVSTIMVTGVGRISNLYMTQTLKDTDPNKTTTDKLALSIPSQISIDECGCLQATNSGAKTNRDQITQNHNEIAGPLIFLGAGVMKLQAFSLNVGCGTTTNGEIGKLTLKAIIQVVLLAMFVIPLVVLVAVNLFRMIYIWGWIIFSPMIVLYNLFEDEMSKRGLAGVKDAISISNIMAGLIQPVATVTALTFGMMLITGMYSALDYTQTETLETSVGVMNGIVNKGAGSAMNIGTNGELGSITLIDKIVDDPTGTIGGGFGYLLIALATCMIMWMMVKMSFSISGDTFKGMGFEATGLMDKMNAGFMKNVKIPGGASLAEATSLMDLSSDKNRLLKNISNRADTSTTNTNNDARDRLKKSGVGEKLGLNDEGELNPKVAYDFGSLDYGNTDTHKVRNTDTQRLFAEGSSIVEDNGNKFKTVPISKGTETYNKVSKWQKSISKLVDETFKDKEGYKKESDFDEIYNRPSYSARLFNYLKKDNELKIEGGKIHPDIMKKLEDMSSAQFSTMTIN